MTTVPKSLAASKAIGRFVVTVPGIQDERDALRPTHKQLSRTHCAGMKDAAILDRGPRGQTWTSVQIMDLLRLCTKKLCCHFASPFTLLWARPTRTMYPTKKLAPFPIATCCVMVYT